MDYRVDFLGENQASAAWFRADNDREAFNKALGLYKARALSKGFELWERGRLVYGEPSQDAGLDQRHFAF